MLKKMKRGLVTLSGESPMQIVEDAAAGSLQFTPQQRKIVRQVGATVRAYLNEAKELLEGKYAHLKDWAPPYLAEPGNVLVGCCADGVVIRYEVKADKRRLIAGWFSESLPEVATMLSQNFVHLYPDNNFVSTIPATSLEFRLSKEDAARHTKEDIIAVKVGCDVVIEGPQRLPAPRQKPYCVLSARNSFEIQLVGELLSEDAQLGQGQRFVARSLFRLGMGWECLEVFPFFDLKCWNSKYAPNWAEKDLLAAVVAHQFREAEFQSLDPNAAARAHFAGLLNEYKNLLNSNPREEVLQNFLRDHPELLCPTKTRVWPKLPLGARQTDFVFQEASRDYLLVELERPSHRLFLKDGHLSQALNHALGQVTDWRRYLEDNLSTVQRELGLNGISANPRSLIVIGRSQSLTPDNRRKLVTVENESPKTKIMTYDDVYENAKAVVENLLGYLWEIQGNAQIYYLPRSTQA